MEKTIYSREYEAVVRQLRESRKKAGITQIQLADRLGLTQSMVSKIERGDRRLDIIELRTACHAIGITLADFVALLEKKLTARRH